MDKKYKSVLVLIGIIAFLIGIIDVSKTILSSNDELPKEIISQEWHRKSEEDTETIHFTKDGKFGYSCSCGNPVDDYDLCDSYKYDEKSKTIKLKCVEKVAVDEIKVVESSEYKLVLDFNGEKREFSSKETYLLDNPLPFAGTSFKTTKGDEITLEFKKDGTFEAYNKTKEEFALGSEICFIWTYDEETNEISLDCQTETRNIKINNYNKNSKELEL